MPKERNDRTKRYEIGRNSEIGRSRSRLNQAQYVLSRSHILETSIILNSGIEKSLFSPAIQKHFGAFTSAKRKTTPKLRSEWL